MKNPNRFARCFLRLRVCKCLVRNIGMRWRTDFDLFGNGFLGMTGGRGCYGNLIFLCCERIFCFFGMILMWMTGRCCFGGVNWNLGFAGQIMFFVWKSRRLEVFGSRIGWIWCLGRSDGCRCHLCWWCWWGLGVAEVAEIMGLMVVGGQ